MEITIKPTVTQHKAWEKLKDNKTDDVLFGGAAGGGKTWLGCEWLLTSSYFFPNTRYFVGREELKRLRDSVLITWHKVLKHHKVPQSDFRYNNQYNYIENVVTGSRIDMLDLKLLPSDPMYERYGSLEYTSGWLEEAGETNFAAYDTLSSRVGRYNNDKYGLRAKMLITCNPKKNWLYREFYKPWKAGNLSENRAFIQSFVADNQYIDSGYVQKLHGLKIKSQKERLLHGNWEYDDDPFSLCSYDAITDMFSNHITEDKTRYITADIARFGEDRTVIVLWEGWHAKKWWVRTKQSTDTTINQIDGIASDYQVPRSRIAVDDIGIGGAVVDGLRGIKGFNAAASPINIPNNDVKFRNLRAQCTFLAADKINERQIKITLEEPEMTELIEEVEQWKVKDGDKDVPIKVIPKEEMKENLGRSPDLADNLIIRKYLDIAEKRTATFTPVIHGYRRRR